MILIVLMLWRWRLLVSGDCNVGQCNSDGGVGCGDGYDESPVSLAFYGFHNTAG